MDDAEVLQKVKDWLKECCIDDTRECVELVKQLKDLFVI
jgi:hypothetical protein